MSVRSPRARSARATRTKPTDAPGAGLNLVVLRGRVADAPQWFELRDGSRVVAFDLVIPTVAGRELTPVSWFGPPPWVSELVAGDELVVHGKVRKRFVASGATRRPFTDVVAHEVQRASRRRGVDQLLARAASQLTSP